MTTTAPDRRAERTRQAVRTAFLDLLFERGFARLTISAVIERANIGRSTFYEHYRTKHDLLRQSLAGPFGTLAAAIDGDATPALAALLRHFRAQQALGRTIFLSPTRVLLRRALSDLITARLAAMCEANPAARPLLPLPSIALQIADLQLGLVEEWTLGRLAGPAEQISAALRASSQATARALLGL